MSKEKATILLYSNDHIHGHMGEYETTTDYYLETSDPFDEKTPCFLNYRKVFRDTARGGETKVREEWTLQLDRAGLLEYCKNAGVKVTPPEP